MGAPQKVIAAQEGFQADFLSTPADIAIGGGAAGAGKSFAILMEALRHHENGEFRAIYFRRTSPELRAPGGLWDESQGLYSLVGGVPRDVALRWTFPSGSTVTFSHMEHEKDKYAHQGAQYALVAFDEVTHFSEGQFWYLVGRLRSRSGVRPYLRATCNPDPTSWVADFISWWIDQETGLAIPERAGVLRWMVRDGEEVVWGSSPEELQEKVPHVFEDADGNQVEDPGSIALSVTFIPGTLADNRALTEADPSYRARLLALSYVDRERLLGGNWKIMEGAGTVFHRDWFRIVRPHELPERSTLQLVRYWDLAGSKRRRSDHTAGVLVGVDAAGVWWVLDVKRIKADPPDTEALVALTAAEDGPEVEIVVEQETGAAAQILISTWLRGILQGYNARGETVAQSGDKLTRAKPASAAAFHELVRVVEAPWTKLFLDELHAFPDGVKDDQVDGFTGAFNALSAGGFAWAV